MQLIPILNRSSSIARFTSLPKGSTNRTVQKRTSILRALELKYVFALFLMLISPFGVMPLHGTTPTIDAAINEELQFQARLLTSGGSLVADGNYNVQFTIYSGGDGAPGGAAETTEWVGSSLKVNGEGVDVVNGYLSEQLGSQTTESTALGNVDWNSDTLWLTVNVGDTTSSPVATDCDTASEFNSNCGGDGEMTPYIRLGSTPYAFNAGQLEGRGADEFVQLDPGGTSQAVNTANAVIDIDQAGAGALLNLEQASSQVFGVANNGDVTSAGDGTFSGGGLTVGDASTAGSFTLYDSDSGSETITLQAGALASSLTFTLPTAYGAAGECLSDSDGAGTLTFTTCSGGGGSSEFTDGGFFLYPSDLSGAESIVIGGTSVANADIYLQATGGAVFNEQAAAVNFRIEGDAQENLFFVDGDLNEIGIGTATPNAVLEVEGTAQASNNEAVFLVDGTLTHNLSGSEFQYGTRNSISVTPSAAASGIFYGFSSTITATNANASGSDIIGINSFAGNSGAITLGDAIGGRFYVNNSSTGTISRAIGLQVTNSLSPSGTIVDIAGLNIAQQTAASDDNVNLLIGTLTIPDTGDYSIYNASSYQNFFAGDLTIGEAANPGQLILSDGTAGTAQLVTLATGNFTTDSTITIPAASASDTVCLLTLANCVGSGGGGAIGGSGTNGTIALFTPDGNNIGDSVITQSSGNISVGGDLTVAATNSFILVGSGTIPGSPTEGEIYYDSTNDQALIYTGSVWEQLNGSNAASVVVAASDSLNAEAADYRADGTADEATIELALADLPATGGTVYLMEGTFNIDDDIDLGQYDRLVGAGDGTVLRLTNTRAANVNIIDFADDNYVASLKIDGNKANQTDSFELIGIAIGSGDANARIENITIVDTENEAIRLAGDFASISNVNIQDSDAAAIWILPAANDVTVSGSYIEGIGNSADEGIEADGTRITVTGNTIVGYRNSVELAGVSVVISSNTISASEQYGINVASTDSLVSGNTIDGTATDGILLSGSATRNTISENSISNAGDEGIVLSTSDENRITDNYIYNSAGDHIRLAGDADNNIVSGNVIRDTAGATDAISIDASTADGNYLANNSFSGTGATTIDDNGTGTIYANQADNSGNLDIAAASNVQISSAVEVLQGSLSVGEASTTDGTFTFFDASSANSVTLGTDNLTANVTYNFADASTGTYTICTTAGNCAGVAGNSLQQAYIAGNTITATDAEGDIDFTLSEATNLSVDITGTGAFLVQDDGVDILSVGDGLNTFEVINGSSVEVIGNINSPFGGFGFAENGLTNSEGINFWTSTNITDSGDVVDAPNNTTTADRLVSTAANGTQTQGASGSWDGAGTYTFSIWLRGDTGGEDVDIRIDSTGGTPATGTAKNIILTTEWRRYWVTQTITGSPTDNDVVIEMNNNAETIYAWGGQITTGTSPGVYANTSDGAISRTNIDYAAQVNGRLNVVDSIFFGNNDGNNTSSFDGNTFNAQSSGSYAFQTNGLVTFETDGGSSRYGVAIDAEAIGDGDGGTVILVQAESADTQTAALTGLSIDLDTNLTVADASTGDQTGLVVTVQDGGASATALGIDLAGTGDDAINVSGTFTNILNSSNAVLNATGGLTLGSGAQAGTVVLSDGSSNELTINTQALGGNYTVSIPTITGNDQFCLAALGNCDGSGVDNEFTRVVAATDSTNSSSADYTADGTADDVEIQSAIDDVSAAGGGIVFLLEGTFTISSEIDMASNVSLVGSGNGATTIILAAGTDTSTTIIGDGAATLTNAEIRDIYIDVNTDGQAAGSYRGIEITAGTGSGATSVSGIKIDNVSVVDVDNGAFYLNSTDNSSLTNSFADCNDIGLTNYLIWMNGGDNNIISNNRFVDCPSVYVAGTNHVVADNYFAATGPTLGAAINATGDGLSITGNVIEDATGDGIEVSGDNTTVTGNVIDNPADEGIRTNSADNVVITGNTISSTGGFSIEMVTSNNATVSNNSIVSSGSDGINANNVDRSVFSDNSIDASTGEAIKLEGTSDYNSISGNTLTNGLEDGLEIDGTNNLISDNVIYDNGDSAAEYGINIDGSSNRIIGNIITDVTVAGTEGIDITGATGTYLSNNVISGFATEDIDDNGTDTVFANQLDESGNLDINVTGNVQISSAVEVLQGTLSVGQDSTADGQLVFYDASGSNTVTLATQNLTADVTYEFADESAGTYTICTTAGNCAGVSGNSLQQAYVAGNTITATDAEGSIAFTLSEATNFITNITGTGSFLVQDGASNIFEIADGGSSTFSGDVTINLQDATDNGLSIRGAASQSDDLLLLRNNGGTTLTTFDQNGFLQITPPVDSSNALVVQDSTNSDVFVIDTSSGLVEVGASVITFSTANNAASASDILFAGGGVISAEDSLFVNIDSDNDTTGADFRIGRNAANSGATPLFTVLENGTIRFDTYDCTGNANGGALTADASGNISCSDDDGGGVGNTLQQAYEAGNTIVATNTEGDIDLTVSEARNFSVDITGTGSFLVQDGGSNVFTVADGGAAVFSNSVTAGGAADTNQLVLTANASQTISNPIVRVNASGGSELFRLTSDINTNIFLGYQAGAANDISGGGNNGRNNTFIGYQAGSNNTNGFQNTVVGSGALAANTVGDYNVALGRLALAELNNASGNSNTALGNQALQGLDGGQNNVAIGRQALAALNGTGQDNNVSIGNNSGGGLTGGDNNIFIGRSAGDNLTSGSNNIFIGYDIDSQNGTDSNVLNIGNLLFSENINGTATTISAGGLGIGVASPTGRLQVVGDEVRIGDAGTVNVALDDGDLYVEDTAEIDGQLLVGGVITASGVGTSTFSSQIQFNGLATDITTATNEDLTVVANGSGIINLNDTVRINGLDCSASANGGALTTNGSGDIICSDDDGGGVGNTLQQAYEAGNTIVATNTEGDIDLTVSEARNFSVDITGTGSFLVQDGGSNVLSVADGTNRLDVRSSGTLPTIGASTVATFLGANAGSTDANISVISGNAGNASVFFGDTDSETVARVAYSNDANELRVFNGVNGLTIETDGSVGINNAAPGSFLSVNADGGEDAAEFISSDGRVYIALQDSADTAYITNEGNFLGLGGTPQADDFLGVRIDLQNPGIAVGDGTANYFNINAEGAIGGNYNVSIPTEISGNDFFCLENANNCSGISQFSDGGTFLYPSDLSGAEDIVIGGTTTGAADIWLQATGAAVFNEQGADADFRVEGDSEVNLLFVDASTNRVGIGTNTPNGRLDVQSTSTLTSGTGQSIASLLAINPSSASTARFDGIESEVNIFPGADVDANTVRNFSSVGTLQATAGLDEWVGYYQSWGYFGSPGTVNRALGVVVEDGFAGAGFTVTDNVGVAIEDITSGTNQINLSITTGGYAAQPSGNFSIYNQSTKSNYFAGNLGIGSTSPDQLLDLEDTVTVDGEVYLRVTNDAQTWDIGVKGDNDDDFVIRRDGTTNVARFGDSAPANSLRVLDSGALLLSQYDCSTGDQYLTTDASGNVICGTDDGGSSLFTDSGAFAYLTTTADDLVIGASSQNASGKLEIVQSSGGLPAISTDLLVQDNANIADQARISLIGGTSGYSTIDFGDTDQSDIGQIAYNHGNNLLSLRTNGTDRLYIASDGDTSVGTSNFIAKFNVLGEAAIGDGADGTGSYLYTGSLGTSDVYLDARSDAANVNLFLRSKGTGAIRLHDGNVILGEQNADNNYLQFSNATNSNFVSLRAQNGSANYALQFPSAAPTVDQCLRAGAVTATDLVFGSCTTSAEWTDAGSYVYPTGVSDTVVIGSDTAPATNAPELYVVESGTVPTSYGTTVVAALQRSASASDWAALAITSGNTGEANIYLGDTDDENIGRVSYDNNLDTIALWTNNGARLTVDADGDVGIGDETPDARLDIQGAADQVQLLVQANSTQNSDIFQVANDTGTVLVAIDDLGGITQSLVGDPPRVTTITDATNLSGVKRIAINGNYLYATARANDRFSIYDISEPESPELVGSIQNSADLDQVRDVQVVGNYAYTVSQLYNGNTSSGSFNVIDVSNPTSPTIVSNINGAGLDGARGIYVSGSYAYVTAQDADQLSIIDISDPVNPSIVGTLVDTGGINFDYPYDIDVIGDYAYIAVHNEDAVTIVDVSDPTSPSVAGSVSDGTNLNGAHSIIVRDRYAYVAAANADRVTIVDVSDPTTPVVVGNDQDAVGYDFGHSAELVGDYFLSVGATSNSFVVANVSDPTAPNIFSTQIDGTNLSAAADVVAKGQYAYVSSTSSNSISVYYLGGAKLTAAEIGTVSTTSLNVQQRATVQILTASDSVNVGAGGIRTSGDAAIDGDLRIGNEDSEASLLILDTKTTSGDPTGVNGAIYYNSNSNNFRCYENGSWTDCITGGGAGATTTASLIPEFAGGVANADGSNNSGTLTSGFVNGLSSSEGEQHNYYEWSTSQTTAQDYDIVVRYQLPQNFGSMGAASTFSFWHEDPDGGTAVGETTWTIYDEDETQCFSTTFQGTTAGVWEQETASTLGSCSWSAGEFVTMVFKMETTNGAGAIRLGEVEFQYDI